MLNKLKNQENIIMIFFVVILLIVASYAVVEKNIIDIMFLGILLFYFVKFLIIRYGR